MRERGEWVGIKKKRMKWWYEQKECDKDYSMRWDDQICQMGEKWGSLNSGFENEREWGKTRKMGKEQDSEKEWEFGERGE